MNTVIPLELRCEYAVNPLGIDVAQPRFSWTLESSQRGKIQTAYQILVASSEEKIKAEIGDKWDSGKVISDQSVNVAYKGRALASGEKCYWKVRVWDEDDGVSAYSTPAMFEMGLLKESDWKGKWIGADTSISAPLLREEFKITKRLKRARVYICALGWYELFINGQKVGDHVLDPAMTDYDKRILYVTYDVTNLLSQGQNAVGVMLGNGWYSEPSVLRYGDSPRLLMQINLEFTDGSTASFKTDETWKVSSGPITRNDFYGGENYDARLEKPGWTMPGYDDSGWESAVLKKSPGGKLVSQLMPPIKVNKTIKPVRITNPKPGVYVYDMGQLFGGWARLHVKGKRGTKVTIKYSDWLFEKSGLVDQERWTKHHSCPETDFYVLKGDGEEVYEPRFTYHPVRYIQVEGYPGKLTLEDLEGRVVHSAVDLTGDFHCSNSLLNAIHRNVVWTLTNELYGMPLDCLHREHWAWTDPATVASTLYARKYMPLFWTKWLNDIKDAQDKNGAVPDIAPNYPKSGSDPAWGSNYPILVWYLYQYYGDEHILEDHYPNMKAWVDYLTSIADNYIVIEGHYGDHMLPGESPGKEEFISKESPPSLIWTGYYYRAASVVSSVANILGKSNDAEHYSSLAKNIKDAFNEKWLNKDTNQYATGSQTANLFPLVLGIVPELSQDGVVRNIVKNIMEQHNGHLHTGNTGTACLIDALADYGRGDVMYEITTKTTYPGWGYMVKQGATTIWESWSRESKVGNADSMIMWASIDEFFYNDLAGIKGPDYYGPGYMSPGWRKIEIKPHVLGDLTSASASIKTVRGMVSSSWKKTDDSLILEVSIPVNSQAKVSIPKMGLKDVIIFEHGKVIWKDGSYIGGVMGITDSNEDADYVTFDVGSGFYSFKLSRASKEAHERDHRRKR